MEKKKFKITWVEIVVTSVVVLILVSVLFPILTHSGRKRRCTTCTSNVRQITMAAMMYVDDNNDRMPGLADAKSRKYVGWVRTLMPYLKGGTDSDLSVPVESFMCTEFDDDPDFFGVTYAYNAALLQHDGMGIKFKDIKAPEMTGVVCDSEFLKSNLYHGGIIGTNNIVNKNLVVKPVGRHNGHIITGYGDGSANSRPFDDDLHKKVFNREFYMAPVMGYVDNPSALTGGIADNQDTNNNNLKQSSIVIDGDSAVMPVLTGVCEVKKQFDNGSFKYSTGKFTGSEKLLPDKNSLVGIATGLKPETSYLRDIYLGRDALIVIVHKRSQIHINKKIDLSTGNPNNYFEGKAISLSVLRKMISSDGLSYPGTTEKQYHWYLQGKYDGTRIAIRNIFKTEINNSGFKGVICKNDYEVIKKVSYDEYGIGIISSAVYDYRKVHALPIADGDKRYFYDTHDNALWPYQRDLYAIYTPNTPAADAVELSFKKYKDIFCSGPLYRYSYWR